MLATHTEYIQINGFILTSRMYRTSLTLSFIKKSNLKEVYNESPFYSIVVFGLVYGNGIAYEQ